MGDAFDEGYAGDGERPVLLRLDEGPATDALRRLVEANAVRLARLDLPEGNAMRAPGEAPGLMALEIAMDEMAEKLGLDPIEFRIRNDTQVDPADPHRPF